MISISGAAVRAIAAVLLTAPMAAAESKVKLSKETTYITAPLADDGLPNYALALIDRQRQGVTPDNNGARLFWQVLGPADLDAPLFARLCEELDIEKPSARFVGWGSSECVKQVEKWIAARRQPGDRSSEEAARIDQAPYPSEEAELFASSLTQLPWIADQIPPAAEWLAQHEAALDLLVETSSKPRFFSPSPDVLDDPATPVIEMLLPHTQAVRGAVRSLSVRAMNRIANRQYDAAWQDILACWRLGARFGDGPTIIERLVGIAIRGIAKNSTLALLQANDLPEQLASQILKDLNEQPSSLKMAETFDRGERFMFLDTALRVTTGRLGGVALGDDKEIFSIAGKVDPNLPLQVGNEWYDRVASAAAMEDWQQRDDALTQIEDDLDKVGDGVKLNVAIAALLSNAKRSEAVGERLVALMIPALSAAVAAEERDATTLILARTAAALAVHRIRAGAYPASLGELVPAVPRESLRDPYAGKPLIYRRMGSGYVLYSVFQNGADDGGSDMSAPIVKGEWVSEDDHVPAGLDETDLVIRLPSPPLKLPELD
jgi:hypothetical protein